MAEQHDRILGYFLEEANEHLNTIEQGLSKLAETLRQPATIRELFRAAHSIKGSAAMLGLNDIQQVGNQFEANFKLLKEQPHIAVDRRLQSLFLESFSFLRAAIDDVKISDDPYRRDPATPDPVGDPVFEELKSYLQHLLTRVNPVLTDSSALVEQSAATPELAVEQVFGEYVTRKMGEITSLSLQLDRPEIRSQIQKICQKLGNLGENFEFLEWTNLFTACRLAIANPHNTLPQLGKSISIAVKQAQILVLSARSNEIDIPRDLAALIERQDRGGQVPAANLHTCDVADPHASIAEVQLGIDETTYKLNSSATAATERLPLPSDLPVPVLSTTITGSPPSVSATELSISLNSIELVADSESGLAPPLEFDDFINALDREPAAYDEETFYTPDLGDIDDRDIAFWSETQLAAQHQALYSALDLPNNAEFHFQPDASPAIELNVAAPDFSVDRPISDLFPTHVTPIENLDRADEWPQNGNEMAVPVESTTAPEVISSINESQPNVEAPQPESLPPHAAPESDVALSLSLDSDTRGASAQGAADSIDLNRDRLDGTANLSHDLTSDLLFLEELSSSRSLKRLGSEDEVSTELTDWLDRSLGQTEVDRLQDVDLDLLDAEKSISESSSERNGDNLYFNSSTRHNLSETSTSSDDDFLGIEELALNSSGSHNIDEISDLLNDDRLLEGSIDNNVASANNNHQKSDSDLSASELPDLDLSGANEHNLEEALSQPAKFEDLSALDFNFDEISSDAADREFTDLENSLAANAESGSVDLGGLDALLDPAVDVGGAMLAGGGAFEGLDDLIGTPAPALTPETDLEDLDRLLAVPTPAPVVVAPEAVADKKVPDRRSKQRTFEQTMRVSVRHLDNLNNLVGELVVNRNTLEQDQNRMRQFVEKLLSEVQKLNDVGKRMQDLYERSLMENSLIASRQQSKPSSAAPTSVPTNLQDLEQAGILMEYDPLEMDRFTPIHLLSQKMIELTVRIRESTADIEFVVDGSTEVTRTLRQITGQLQEDLTKSRMVPFAQTADRLQRGVRDNGLKYDKQVELSVEGRDTLIDKVILESLTDPLIHMVNNAIAHGIESAETRQAAGKPSDGKITIRALHQGNQTIISISDDGAGINTERVKAKAIEKGIITIQQAAAMSKADAYELLFLPSFSTKDQADELAGRGVGMDVVRTSLTEIRGTITTESQLGLGTTFTIRLPLALSIAKALIAVNNKTNVAFPMDGIEDTQDVSPEQIQTNQAGEQCIFWRDELMPFKPLSDLLGFNRPLARNNFYGTQEDDSDLISILILRSDGNLIAVQVDKIVGDQEIVIKPLQGPAPKPLGIAGATVLGDGRIVPIADVMELIALAKGTLTRHVSTQWTNQIITPTVAQRESMVLIVDDSITVRELLSLTFKRAGYRVEQARDGQEAWDKLRAGLPCDIVFCDIEMPRMDGLEFLSRIQKDVALKKVPVAMLTSRGSDRHRQIASQLGASGYFIKPYLEEALLDAAKRMIKGEVLAIV